MMLLDEPTAGMTHEDVERITALIKRVAANRTVLMVEHNLSVVSTLSDTSPCSRAARSSPRATTRRVEESRRRAGLPGSRPCLRPSRARAAPARRPRGAPLLAVRGLNAWYGESHILHGVDFDVRSGEVVTLLGRNGAGKTTTLRVDHGHRAAARRLDRVRGQRDDRACRRTASRGAASPTARRSAASSRASTSRRTCCCRRSCARAGCRSSRSSSCSRTCKERLREPGHQALGRRAADARDRPHPAHRRAPAAARRADRRAGAGDRPADRAHDRASSRRRASRSCWSSRISASRRPSRTGTTSWSTAASST